MILRYFLITSRVRLAVVCGVDRFVGDSSYCKVMQCETSYRRSIVQCENSSDPMTRHNRLKCLVVACNNEYSSRNLLLKSEPLKTQMINVSFVLKWMRRSPIYINASMFAQIIRGPVSSTEEGFYEYLKITFPNNVLVSQFHSEV